jgi:hypothetical protein
LKVTHFSSSEAYHRNNTEKFAEVKLNTEEDMLYIICFTCVEDASSTMQKLRDKLFSSSEQLKNPRLSRKPRLMKQPLELLS